MSARRRPASRSPSPAADSVSRSPSPPRRQSREVRISAGSSADGRSSGVKLSASRTRRPTPVVKRSSAAKSGRLSDVIPHDHHHHQHHHHRHDESASDEDEDEHEPGHDHDDHHHDDHDDDAGNGHGNGQRKSSSRRQVSINTESRPNGRGGRTRQVTLASNSALDGSPLTWYERLLPEFVLNMTSPVTGYENELARHGELDDYEFEILERERKRRNRRIRRRLALVVLAAGLASAFFIYRGRLPTRRPPGVRGAITAMTSRLEDGLQKTIHDTMGK